MTSTVMLAAVRTILDEASESFWTDAEIYAALADAQNDIIDKLLAVYRSKKAVNPHFLLPYTLQSLLNDDTGSTQTVTVPAGYLELISATFDHDASGAEEPCKIINQVNKNFREDNTFLSATSTDPVVYVKSVSDVIKLAFLPTLSGSCTSTIHFIKSPTDIASGQNALLPVITHNAHVHFAAARMLEKDQRPQEAQQHQQIYLQELQTVN